ncbi:MAG: hypothetical protein HQL10_03395 [Nitrospirae bacterium]|nr:hypothetical protein [Nitrospirota bacterium]
MAKTTKKTVVKKTKAATVKTVKKAAAKKAKIGFTVKTGKEITATFPDSTGLTAKVAAAIAAENVNILAATGYSASEMRRMATFTLIVDDLVRAERALEKIGATDIQESSIVLVETPNKVGSLKVISKLIADAGINIYYFYSTTSSGKTATCVFKTADDKKTMKILREA